MIKIRPVESILNQINYANEVFNDCVCHVNNEKRKQNLFNLVCSIA